MRASRHAIIILYMGEDAPAEVLKSMTDNLVMNNLAIPELTTVIHKDEAAVTNAILGMSLAENQPKDVSLTEAVKNAVIYIGKRFEASLKGTNGPIGNIALFAIELSNAVTIARQNMSFIGVGMCDELLTAIEIISTSSAVIPAALAKKYHFTQNVVDVIKKVYNTH